MPDGKGKEKKKVVIKKITPLSVQQKKDTFQRFEDGINQQNKVFRRELKITVTNQDRTNKVVKIVPIQEEEGCFCGNHYFDGDWLKGDNVIHSRKDSKVKAQGEQQKPIGIILHRLEGWDTSGGIQKSIGTHFFIEKPFRDRKILMGKFSSQYHSINIQVIF